MKKNLVVLFALLAMMIALSACSATAPEGVSQVFPENNQNVAQSPNATSEQLGISASQAGAVAVEMVGGGNMLSLETITINDSIQFIVSVDYNGSIYDVVLDAQSGNLISLKLTQKPEQQEPMYAEYETAVELSPSQAVELSPPQAVELSPPQDVFASAPDESAPQPPPSPQPPSSQPPSPQPPNPQPPSPQHISGRGNRPANPAISLERAIEIGYEELARRGHAGTFRNHSGMDWAPRYGGWVWELLFRAEGGRLPLVEMYICVNTGNVMKFEWDD